MSRDNGFPVESVKFIGDIKVDVVLRVDHNSDITLTSFPVEDGTVFTDHRIILPKSILLTCSVSDIKGQSGFFGFGGDESESSRSTYEALVLLQESAVPFDVITNLRSYPNMLIETLSTFQDFETANELTFQASLQEVQIATTESVPLPKEKISAGNNSAKDRGQSTLDQGTQSPEEKGPITSDDNRSFISKIIDGASKFF